MSIPGMGVPDHEPMPKFSREDWEDMLAEQRRRQEHDDLTCNECGHNSDDHPGNDECLGNYPGTCDCVGFDSISNAAERQGMKRAAEAGYGL